MTWKRLYVCPCMTYMKTVYGTTNRIVYLSKVYVTCHSDFFLKTPLTNFDNLDRHAVHILLQTHVACVACCSNIK